MADVAESRDPVYRTGAGYPILIAWTLCSLGAFISILLSLHPHDRTEHAGVLRWLWALLILFGPLSLAFYLIRRGRVFIQVDDARGLLLGGRELIPWIRSGRWKPSRDSWA